MNTSFWILEIVSLTFSQKFLVWQKKPACKPEISSSRGCCTELCLLYKWVQLHVTMAGMATKGFYITTVDSFR